MAAQVIFMRGYCASEPCTPSESLMSPWNAMFTCANPRVDFVPTVSPVRLQPVLANVSMTLYKI